MYPRLLKNDTNFKAGFKEKVKETKVIKSVDSDTYLSLTNWASKIILNPVGCRYLFHYIFAQIKKIIFNEKRSERGRIINNDFIKIVTCTANLFKQNIKYGCTFFQP